MATPEERQDHLREWAVDRLRTFGVDGEVTVAHDEARDTRFPETKGEPARPYQGATPPVETRRFRLTVALPEGADKGAAEELGEKLVESWETDPTLGGRVSAPARVNIASGSFTPVGGANAYSEEREVVTLRISVMNSDSR